MARFTFPVVHFNELTIDDEFESLARTVTEADIVNFAGLSGDYTPIHIDHEHAKSGPFQAPIAHGLLGLAIASGLGSMCPRADTVAFIGFRDWKFVAPILAGDTIRVVTSVIALESRSRGRRGLVTWRRRVVNQRGETVQEGVYETIVASSPTPARPSPASPAPVAPPCSEPPTDDS